MSILKRWPKRREFLAYYMLLVYSKRKSLETINAGEAADVLYLLTGSRRLAQRLLRTLVRQGYLKRVQPLVYSVRDLDEVLGDALGHYIASRLRRRGIEASYDPHRRLITVRDDAIECDKMNKMFRDLGYGVECLSEA